MSLIGKIAIVTGASRGIGASIAIELARQGAKVALTYSSPESESDVDEVLSKITSLCNGSAAIKVLADLKDPKAVDKVIYAALPAFPTADNKIDILVNNAGVPHHETLVNTSPETISSVFDVNVHGTIRMTKAVIPHLRSPGRIINIGSIAARRGATGYSIYCASKAAVEGFTRALACELGPEGHTVNVIEPGAVETRMLRDMPADVLEYVKMSTPLGNRCAAPEEISRVAVFLAGEDAGWVTGQTICVSGGLEMI
ncbi:hypothetical protein EYZ11_003961 [Aspergillus tanneri]|uniref:Ketoreductase domain-containing protein n=1 Tax=Aspergillus tanneri TaxID=1220188 RepID=A0A4S3JLS7_9EURO|nr:uncharacterized protein ATNIH1004_010942 [Aspergillus tanneri]KAA8642003.1 hypothetical protein ATNIH1004_010942 [Aspergillus tanneri]THC96569.1 hypothetical protein EYZ11_003961 [Aspergillus tanneri]